MCTLCGCFIVKPCWLDGSVFVPNLLFAVNNSVNCFLLCKNQPDGWSWFVVDVQNLTVRQAVVVVFLQCILPMQATFHYVHLSNNSSAELHVYNAFSCYSETI